MNSLIQKKIAYCFLVSNEARDFHLLTPFIYYLERYENFEVTFEFVWDAQIIRKKRPDMVILPNCRGHKLYYEIAKYAFENNILVFHNDSEGNFNTEIDYDYWGFNRSKKIYSPIHFAWNEKVKSYLIKKYNFSPSEIKISGAPGFDKYQYTQKINRKNLLKKYGKDNFEKVIGYAGWAFGKLQNKELPDLLSNLGMNLEKGQNWLVENRDFVENCLKEAIEAFPEILFILKKHPRENFESDYRDSRNEMNRLAYYDNVLYLKDQEEIQDLIQISDLWMAFESTSIMESWILKIPTLLINKEINFTRADLYKGSRIVFSREELLIAIENLYSSRKSDYFNSEDVVKERNMIFSKSIGFIDGLNHLRCAYHFKPFFQTVQKHNEKPKLNFGFLKMYYLLRIGKIFYRKSIFEKLPKFKKTIWVFENRSLDKIKLQKSQVYKELDDFYSENDLDKRISNGSLWEHFSKEK